MQISFINDLENLDVSKYLTSLCHLASTFTRSVLIQITPIMGNRKQSLNSKKQNLNKVLNEKIAAMDREEASHDLASPTTSKSAASAMPSNADLMKMLTVMNTNLDTKFDTYTASTNKQLTTIGKDVVTNRNSDHGKLSAIHS